MTGNVTHTHREIVLCQVRRDAPHRGAGAHCAPGARWARFLFPTRPARTDATAVESGKVRFNVTHALWPKNQRS